MAGEAIITIATRHQSHYERLKSAEVAKFDSFLKLLDADVRRKLSGVDITELTRARLEKQLAQIRALLSGTLDDYATTWRESVTDAALYEADFERRALENVVDGVEFSMPSDKQLTAAVFNKPLGDIGGPDGGALLDPFIEEMSARTVKRIEGAIRLGYAQGETTAQVLQRVRGTRAAGFRDGIMANVKRDAEAITRTALQHAASVAREMVWAENDDVIAKIRITATLDDRTSTICRSLDGQEYQIDEGPRPPFHVNCLTGDTYVTSCSRISHVYKRRYEGAMVYLRTKAGRALTITPNHPVLTRNGWKAAKLVDDSDDLVHVSESDIRVNNDECLVKSGFSDLFAAANVARNSFLVGNRPAASKYFHGDISDGEINVINVDGLVWNAARETFVDSAEKILLKGRSGIGLSLARFGAQNFFTMGHGAAARGIMRSLGEMRYLFWGGSRHSGALLFATAADFHPETQKAFFYYSWPNPERFCNTADSDARGKQFNDASIIDFFCGALGLAFDSDSGSRQSATNSVCADKMLARNILNGCSGSIHFDRVVDYRVGSFSGHVFNLENKDNWYLSNGIITHNCRTTTTAVLSPEFAALSKGRTRAARDPETGEVGKTSANQTYYGWLKTQPANVQDSILGESRGALLRDGGISAERFAELQLGKNFQPLTLDEMRKLDPVAFERAGL